jgi:tRNA(Ile)-lysidine synthase
VATAHTADDQVETILLHVLRGAGPAGWGGMPADRVLRLPAAHHWERAEVRLVRPLLGVWRRELEARAAERGLAWVTDASNQDTGFTRNRLRHQVLPHLDAINPRWREALLRTAGLVADEHAAVEAIADAAWSHVAEEPASQLRLRIAALAAQPRALQRVLLRRAVARVVGEPALADLPLERVEAALALLGAESGRRVELGHGLVVEREYQHLVVGRALSPAPSSNPGGGEPRSAAVPPGGGELQSTAVPGLPHARQPRPRPAGREGEPPSTALPPVPLPQDWAGCRGCGQGRGPAPADQEAVPVQVPGETLDPGGGWWLRARLLAPEEWRLETSTPCRVGLDADALSGGLIVRSRRPGDRLQPLGMQGIKKLHDVMIDAKVPRHARRHLRVLESPAGIAWAIGLRIADWAKVTPATRRVLELEYESNP